MVYEEIFTQLSLWRMVIFGLNLTPFASNLSSIFMCGSGNGSVFRIRIRIHKAPEYGSGSTTLSKMNIFSMYFY